VRYLASHAASRAATDAILIHGAYGFGKDLPLERYLRDVAEAIQDGGSPLIHKLVVARHALGISRQVDSKTFEIAWLKKDYFHPWPYG
jgi:alkylation response protein AidB-like acyl-CoA dehydrogenase